MDEIIERVDHWLSQIDSGRDLFTRSEVQDFLLDLRLVAMKDEVQELEPV